MGDELSKHGLGFHSSEWCADAHVWAVAEGDVGSRVAVSAVLVGFVEDCGVAIRRPEGEQDA